MPRGGARPGAGRRLGSKSQIARERDILLHEAMLGGITPLAYMLNVMRDPKQPAARRDNMAALAAPYVHPRLQLQAVAVEDRRFSSLPPEQREHEAQRLITEARALLENARAGYAGTIIDGEAKPVYESEDDDE